jgi:hypothetical protein
VNGKVISLGRVLRTPKKSLPTVDTGTTAARLRTAREYLDWLAQEHLARRQTLAPEYLVLDQRRLDLREQLNARVPPQRCRNQENSRTALSVAETDVVILLIDPSSSENPWKDPFVRLRNQLMVHTQLGLGLRAGELLKIKITEIDFQNLTIFISRSPDDPKDPRTRAPQTKTRDRKISISEQLARMLHYLQTSSASHASNLFQRFVHFSRTVYGDAGSMRRQLISPEDVMNYKGALAKQEHWYLGALRGFFKTWQRLGYPGIDPNVVRVLKQMKLSGNAKGDHVRSMDPDEGPRWHRLPWTRDDQLVARGLLALSSSRHREAKVRLWHLPDIRCLAGDVRY